MIPDCETINDYLHILPSLAQCDQRLLFCTGCKTNRDGISKCQKLRSRNSFTGF